MKIKCEIIQPNPETDIWPECGKDAVGYSSDGVAVCLSCQDDDTLKITKWIGPCLDETKNAWIL